MARPSASFAVLRIPRFYSPWETGKQVVGRDSFSDYPAVASSITDIGGSTGNYDTDAIAALHPDLVLAGEINTTELINSLQKLGLTVYYLPNLTTLEGMFANLETVGQLKGHSSQAVFMVKSLRQGWLLWMPRSSC